jgi:hypothetical protein
MSRKINIIRDAEGKIVRIENPDGFLTSGDSVMIAAFIDGIRNAVKEFDKSTEKYSRRMEKLTIAMLTLAIVQIAVAAVTVYITLIAH